MNEKIDSWDKITQGKIINAVIQAIDASIVKQQATNVSVRYIATSSRVSSSAIIIFCMNIIIIQNLCLKLRVKLKLNGGYSTIILFVT